MDQSVKVFPEQRQFIKPGRDFLCKFPSLSTKRNSHMEYKKPKNMAHSNKKNKINKPSLLKCRWMTLLFVFLSQDNCHKDAQWTKRGHIQTSNESQKSYIWRKWEYHQIETIAVTGVSQWLGHPPTHQNVTYSIPSQGTCLGWRLRPRLGLGFGFIC